ncbi:MAG: hypothetical protein GXP41_08745 [Chloroflexi bacterium]|nr:hypothetical protein [Chloroflexota bacterium]
MSRKHAWIAILLLILVTLACSIGGGGSPAIGKVAVATALDKDYKAVSTTETYTPTQTFHLSVQVSNLEKGSALLTKWYQGDKLVKEYPYSAEDSGSGYVGFSLTPKETWPIGKYRAEVYLGDELAQTVQFSVVPPDDALPSRVTQVTLARSTDENLTPVDPTITFQEADTVNAVIAGDFGIYSQVRCEWYLNGELSKETITTITMQENASKTAVACTLKPPLPTGTQQVKIYLDGNVERALDFAVLAGTTGAIPQPGQKTTELSAPVAEADATGVAILSHRAYVDHNRRLWVVFEVKNSTGRNLRGLTGNVSLIDAKGNEVATGTISPKTTVITADDKIPFGLFWSPDKLDLSSVVRYQISLTDYQETAEPAKPSPWKILDVSNELSDEGDIILTGTMQNGSDGILNEAETWATIYNAEGNMLGGGMSTLSFGQAILPGEQADFKLTISGPLKGADHFSVVTVASPAKGLKFGKSSHPPLTVPTFAPAMATPTPSLTGRQGLASPTPAIPLAPPAATPAPPSNANLATYTHSGWGFTLQYPAGWEVDDQTSQVIIGAPDDSAGFVLAAADLQGQQLTSRQLMDIFIAGLADEVNDFQATPALGGGRLDGELASTKIVSLSIDGKQAQGDVITTVHNGWAYMFLVLAEEGKGNSHELTQILMNSLRWGGPSATPTSPSAAAPTGQLMYTVWHGPGYKDYSLLLVNVDGSGGKKIVDQASEPSWSPDGKRFVFYHWTDGLYIANADGSGAHKIVADGEATYPDWSSKGDRIVYASPLGGGKFKLFLVIDTGGVTSGKDLGPGNRPAWSPDGKRIAYDNCDSQGHCGIWLMNEDGGNPHALTEDGGGQAAWSPDGRHIAYASPADGDYEVVIINSDGSGRRQLTHNTGNDALPTWSRDGQFIFYRTDQNGTAWAIYRMRADGSDKRKFVDAQVNPDRWQWERMDAK